MPTTRRRRARLRSERQVHKARFVPERGVDLFLTMVSLITAAAAQFRCQNKLPSNLQFVRVSAAASPHSSGCRDLSPSRFVRDRMPLRTLRLTSGCRGKQRGEISSRNLFRVPEALLYFRLRPFLCYIRRFRGMPRFTIALVGEPLIGFHSFFVPRALIAAAAVKKPGSLLSRSAELRFASCFTQGNPFHPASVNAFSYGRECL